MNELRTRGLNAEAEEISNLLNGTSPPHQPKQPLLKKACTCQNPCPACGAAVKPDEVEWLDDITAECSYCGARYDEK
ncbi:MAG: hypothetical protein IPO22_16095 [Anaerolineales bacterium]|nr:hypothetical protein [Anaerolineales bacterium]